jgi:rSAM/selenodomain-associated transferase 2
MKISVVVPVLNEAKTLPSMMAALAPLRARGCEIIVADGGSSDGSAEIASKAEVLVVTGAKGRARQMNAGAERASGDAYLFLHADTRLPPDADRLIETALASGRFVWGRFDVRIEGRARTLALVATAMNWRSRLTGIATGDQAIFVTRAAFAAAGGFPDQELMEDVELSRRLKLLSPPACVAQKVTTSGRRWESHGVWPTIFLMWRLRFDYWRGVAPSRLAERYR